jgi:tripartite-type tricarboxylate transporter receptor subunit TctC
VTISDGRRPHELRDRIAADVKEAISDPTIVSRLQATGQDVVPGSAAEFAASIDKQRAAVAETARILGIKAATQQAGPRPCSFHRRASPLRVGCL